MFTMTMVHFACDVCEVIRNFTVSFLKETWRLCQVFGYARAAGQPLVRPSRCATAPLQNPVKTGSWGWSGRAAIGAGPGSRGTHG